MVVYKLKVTRKDFNHGIRVRRGAKRFANSDRASDGNEATSDSEQSVADRYWASEQSDFDGIVTEETNGDVVAGSCIDLSDAINNTAGSAKANAEVAGDRHETESGQG